MILSSIEKMAKDIGFDIGASNDQIQADLLNGFCAAIHQTMQHQDRGTQICYIVNKLDPRTCTILKEFYEFIKIKEED